ncbi:hypothetical protein BGX23_002701 [Mortierella sp. AD031]|nr:hypothetical protein BGX23_002701 [Mortierella sp. AD031]
MATKSLQSTNSSDSSSSGTSFHSRHGSTISVLSVPLMDPFYRDLVALKTDYSALYAELKRTQQTLQLSYQDLMMAQERSKRAETDSGRLKTQMETILKKHVDHHPEREALVQQMAELQTRLDIELGARQVLEQEHGLLQHELIRLRLSNTATTTTAAQQDCSQCGGDGGPGTGQKLAHESFQSREQLQAQKLFYDKLAEENVAMKMEIQDLRYLNKAEKDSIKGYMSLFESLQKKQSNALAVAQAEIDLLRGTIQEHILRLESREHLLQTFAATVNSQAIEIQILTGDACRERASRAKTEQEMASLLEASLLMLERLFVNVDQAARSELVRVLDPVRQTIHHLEIPSILQEWELCEQGVQRVVNDIARSLVLQQEVQERGLTLEGAGGARSGGAGGGAAGSLVKSGNHNHTTSGNSSTRSNSSSSTFNQDHRRGSISSTHSAMTAMTTFSSGSSRSNHGAESSEQEAVMILDNNFSQQVFVWRKFTADTFLEECVKGVEDLAQERRQLQTRIVELTRVIVEQDEARCLKELAAACSSAADVETVATEAATETGTESTTRDKETTDLATNTPAAETDLSPDSSKDSLEDDLTESAPTAEASSANQENHPMDQQESPLNSMESERTKRLESILQKVLELSGGHLQTFKKNSEPSSANKEDQSDAMAVNGIDDDDILSLDISEAPVLEEQTPLIVIRSELSTVKDTTTLPTTISDCSRPKKDDLETLLQLIRQELTGNTVVATTAPSLQRDSSDASPTTTAEILETIGPKDIFNGDSEAPAEVNSTPSEPFVATKATPPLTIITTDTSTNIDTTLSADADTVTRNNSQTRTQTRPEVKIPTTLARGTSYSSTCTSLSSTVSTPTSLASSTTTATSTSTSNYFSSKVQLGSLSIPSSPGLSGVGGPDGHTLLDVEALCRDLAFRSFPKQHQWSKKSKNPPTWYSSVSSFSISSSASGLPPLPPLPSSSTTTTSS